MSCTGEFSGELGGGLSPFSIAGQPDRRGLRESYFQLPLLEG
jgi:hypothetical protein